MILTSRSSVPDKSTLVMVAAKENLAINKLAEHIGIIHEKK
jgi:hypothetical protein